MTHKPLPTTICIGSEQTKNKSILTQKARDGRVCLYARKSVSNPSLPEAYEVIIVQSHNGIKVAGIEFPPSEYYPSTEQWQTYGFSFPRLDIARDFYDILRKKTDINTDTKADAHTDLDVNAGASESAETVIHENKTLQNQLNIMNEQTNTDTNTNTERNSETGHSAILTQSPSGEVSTSEPLKVRKARARKAFEIRFPESDFTLKQLAALNPEVSIQLVTNRIKEMVGTGIRISGKAEKAGKTKGRKEILYSRIANT